MAVLVIVGATAVGKTTAGVALAKRTRGVIVSCDSRQMYRELIIGAGKEGALTQREIRGVGLVPSRRLSGIDQVGVDLFSIKDSVSVKQFVDAVVPMIEGLLAERFTPIIVGGSGLYVEGVSGLRVFARAKPNPKRRAELEEWSTKRLLERLVTLAPERVASIDFKNRRRIVRAIEIAEAHQTLAAQPRTPRWETKIFGINPPRAKLYELIDKRLEHRFEGIIAETRALLAEGVPAQRLDDLGLEYRFANRIITQNEDPKKIKAELKFAIHAFARRQITWFKKLPGVTWFESVEELVTHAKW